MTTPAQTPLASQVRPYYFAKWWVWALIVAITLLGGALGELWAHQTQVQFAASRSSQSTLNAGGEFDFLLLVFGVGMSAAIAFLLSVCAFAILEVAVMYRRLQNSSHRIERLKADVSASLGTKLPAT
jgi:hypothetical protein